MNFKEATSQLVMGCSHADIADAMGVSISSVRQYRLPESANAYRKPPPDWREQVIRMSEKQILKHRRIIAELSGGECSD
jgi:predicted transcriptional regulator